MKIRLTEGRGRGVFATKSYAAGTTIEVCEVIELSLKDHKRLQKTKLHDYVFQCDDGVSILALGNGSLYNHGQHNNASATLCTVSRKLHIRAVTNIGVDEEILIDYSNGNSDMDLGFAR